MHKYRRFFWVAPALALVLVFAGNALAGPNADATAALDIELESGDGNETNDGVTSVTLAGDGTEFDVEIFVTGAAVGLVGASIEFDTLDVSGKDVFTEVVEITDNDSEFNFAIPGVDAINWADGNAITIPESGYLGVLTLETQVDVTGLEFSLQVKTFLISTSAAAADTDTLTVTTVLLFNSTPKATIPAEAASGVEVPSGGVAEPVRVTVAGFAAGANLTWNVKTTGTGATIEVLDDAAAVMTGSTFTSTSTFIDIKATDAGGDLSVEVWAESGGVSSDSVTVMFSRQLPVELASFGGELIDDSVVLNWTTASQTNNAGWRVLRSLDGATYEQVGELVLGAGTSDALQSYSFADNKLPSSEKAFYVLEQIDLDGTVHRSNQIEMLMGARFLPAPTEFAVNAYPNPFNPSTTLAYDLPSDAIVNIVIYDALGQEVRRLVATQRNAGRYTIQWDARDNLGHGVGSGVYIAKIKAGTFSASQKMLLLK